MKHQKLVTSEQVSNRMSRVGLKKNKYERMLATALWHKGYRYRLNYKKLPGSPDIAILKYQLAIFVDGEFWHGKNFVKDKRPTKNNSNYWSEKIEENIQRDEKNDRFLRQMGWIPIHFWSEDVSKYLEECLLEIDEQIEELLKEKEGEEYV